MFSKAESIYYHCECGTVESISLVSTTALALVHPRPASAQLYESFVVIEERTTTGGRGGGHTVSNRGYTSDLSCPLPRPVLHFFGYEQ